MLGPLARRRRGFLHAPVGTAVALKRSSSVLLPASFLGDRPPGGDVGQLDGTRRERCPLRDGENRSWAEGTAKLEVLGGSWSGSSFMNHTGETSGAFPHLPRSSGGTLGARGSHPVR